MAKIKKEWKLPKPEDHGDHFEWKPVVRIGWMVPFGYEKHPEDPDILLPVPEKLELLEQAKAHLKNYSYRAVAAWLSEQSGQYISHVGLYKRVKLEQKRRTAATNQRYLAQRYKEALEKAEKLERMVGGPATRVERTGDSEGSGETEA